jgi:hypothetical protein
MDSTVTPILRNFSRPVRKEITAKLTNQEMDSLIFIRVN